MISLMVQTSVERSLNDENISINSVKFALMALDRFNWLQITKATKKSNRKIQTWSISLIRHLIAQSNVICHSF